MKEAFTYMFKDSKFLQKALPYGALILTIQYLMLYAMRFVSKTAVQPQYFFWFLLALVLTIIPIGFMYASLKSVLENKELPYMNVKQDFVRGLKFAAGWILLMVTYTLLLLLCFLVLAVIGAIIAKMNTVLGALLHVFCILLCVISIFLLIAYAIALECIFAKTEKITSFLCIRKATRIIKGGVGTYAKGAGLFFLLSIAFGIINNIVIACTGSAGFIGMFISSVIVAAISVYFMYVMIAVKAKSVNTEVLEQNCQQ